MYFRPALLLLLVLALAPLYASAEAIKINRYCNSATGQMRYAGDNVTLPVGFEQCGTVESRAWCDTTGRKVYGSWTTRPAIGFRPCEDGPRIEITTSKVVSATAIPSEPPVSRMEEYAVIDSEAGSTAPRSGIDLSSLGALLGKLASGSQPGGAGTSTKTKAGTRELDLKAIGEAVTRGDPQELMQLLESFSKGLPTNTATGTDPKMPQLDLKQLLGALGAP